ncbi:hypothetical protein M438DRAFT_348615 [Aureobasidium pullulans EXF-150]|uniref:Uncharacterized protein n=1 Tax=Aureobasidium pullulans EXF-150 TaxID=1043002 RepID=A0A074X5Q1_AURPU|nr:uncharacterized protein M438DRAFT_348615 [Aureobasidium pullulans EXF-150]KEQ80683.1 hypothetical protein M438DRAFT_348615 [Aureobasidium pullulans EXF-150]
MRELVRDLAQELEAEGIRSCGHGEHLVVDAQARIFWADNDPVLTKLSRPLSPRISVTCGCLPASTKPIICVRNSGGND